MRRQAVVAAAAAAVVLGGCGVLGGGSAAQRGAVDAAPAGCPDDAGTEQGTWYSSYDLLAADVEPTAVVRCVPERVTDDTGRWSAVVAQTSAGEELPALLQALRRSDDPVPFNGACDASLSLLPWLAVVLPDGRWQPVGVPVDACGHPQRDAVAALDAAPWSESAPVKLTRLQTRADVARDDLAGDAGCAPTWKDELGLVTEGLGQTPTAGLPPSGRVTVCRYSITAPGQDGTWVGGGPVLAPRADDVRAAVASSTVAPACAAERTGFVVVTGNDGNQVTVDLGCPRVLVGSAVGSVPPSTVDLLLSLTPEVP